jgi:hypothetical protein
MPNGMQLHARVACAVDGKGPLGQIAIDCDRTQSIAIDHNRF